MSVRNNFERTQTSAEDESAPVPTEADSPSDLSSETPTQQMTFSVPTEFVELPSKGKFYLQGHPLHGVDTLEIKFMTAKEEDILTSKTLLKKNLTIDRLLRSVIIDRNVDPLDLLVADRNAIIVAARITGYGSQYSTSINCPSCNATNGVNIDLEKALEEGLEDVEIDEEDATLTENGTYIVETPRTGAKVEIKFLNGHDEKRYNHVIDQRKKLKLPESVATSVMASFIVSVNGSSDPHYIGSFIENAPAADARYVRRAFTTLTPGKDMSFNFCCSECDHEARMEVPLNAEFFWPK